MYLLYNISCISLGSYSLDLRFVCNVHNRVDVAIYATASARGLHTLYNSHIIIKPALP
jgi:hypothetical protein